MNKYFWDMSDVYEYSPWGKSVTLQLVDKGIIPGFKNPLSKSFKTPLKFIPEQVKQAFIDMANKQTEERKNDYESQNPLPET